MFEHDNSVLGQEYFVSKEVHHQDIGGKRIILEFGLSVGEVVQLSIIEGNWACKNFMDRRSDFNYDFDKKLYYGKVGGLGYIIAEDELVEII